MSQQSQAPLSKERLLERLAQSTLEVTEATLAYRQWSQLRTAAGGIVERWKGTVNENSDAYEKLLDLITWTSERCSAIETFLDTRRHLHEVWLFQLDELEHEFA